MADQTGIQWTDATWNPVAGCSVYSPGCKGCFAMEQAMRQIRCAAGLKRETHYAGTVKHVKGKAIWTGKLVSAPDHIWEKPLHWRKPKKVFVNSMSDLFHQGMRRDWIDRTFATMALAPHITFQLLTKRSREMRAYLSDPETPRRVYELVCDMTINQELQMVLIAPGINEEFAPAGPRVRLDQWPLPNVWLGVSTERQKEANQRIPDLMATPAAIRFISAEPLIGPIDLDEVKFTLSPGYFGSALRWHHLPHCDRDVPYPKLDWVICGGESGGDARPMHPQWARTLRDQCAAEGVPFFFKQWGEYAPVRGMRGDICVWPNGRTEGGIGGANENGGAGSEMDRVGKRDPKTLDGVAHLEFPTARIAA